MFIGKKGSVTEMASSGRNNIWALLSLISQLSISLLTPVFMMLVVCLWLQKKFSLGRWVVLAGILLGLGSGISTVWKILKKFTDTSD